MRDIWTSDHTGAVSRSPALKEARPKFLIDNEVLRESIVPASYRHASADRMAFELMLMVICAQETMLNISWITALRLQERSHEPTFESEVNFVNELSQLAERFNHLLAFTSDLSLKLVKDAQEIATDTGVDELLRNRDPLPDPVETLYLFTRDEAKGVDEYRRRMTSVVEDFYYALIGSDIVKDVMRRQSDIQCDVRIFPWINNLWDRYQIIEMEEIVKWSAWLNARTEFIEKKGKIGASTLHKHVNKYVNYYLEKANRTFYESADYGVYPLFINPFTVKVND